MTTDYRPALSPETRDDLTVLAQHLDICIDGIPSVPNLLEALGEVYHSDPGGTVQTLKVLLKENGLLPARPREMTEES